MAGQEAYDMSKRIERRYKAAIAYYWRTSRSNKRWYKITRSSTIILGALVTLMTALSSSTLLANAPTASGIISWGTPILAALLTMIGGFSQTFQWGSTWHQMVITAERLEKDLDRFLVTPCDKRDFAEEAEELNDLIIKETETFFERLLGGAKRNNDTNSV